MKKNFLLGAAVLLAAATVSLSSCGGGSAEGNALVKYYEEQAARYDKINDIYEYEAAVDETCARIDELEAEIKDSGVEISEKEQLKIDKAERLYNDAVSNAWQRTRE